MSERDQQKPGFWGRLFGLQPEPAPAPAPKVDETPEAEKPAEPERPAELEPTSPASFSEGQLDFTTAAAAGEIPAVPPSVTEESPETPAEDKPEPELAGASLQPVARNEPEGSGPSEPIPRLAGEAAPTAASAVKPETAPQPDVVPPAIPSWLVAPSTPPAAQPAADTTEPGGAKKGWWSRLSEGMRRTSSTIGDSVTGLFTKRKLDHATLEDLEDVLVQADLGVETATRITQAVGHGRYDREVSAAEVKAILAAEVEKVLLPVAKPLVVDRSKKPFVLLMVGVNGAGKTTTIGKLAQKFMDEKLKVTLAAGDTFRAAAIEQLKVWGERTGVPVIAGAQGADAAGLAFDALTQARESGADVLMIDTAGRLQNKTGLMAELEKIIRVIRKVDPEAPHATLLVLDATVGQNALSQVEIFKQAADVTGLVMTKLDGTARGGILVALAVKFGLPVHYIGVGEGVEDLEPFAARDFARAIAGLEKA